MSFMMSPMNESNQMSFHSYWTRIIWTFEAVVGLMLCGKEFFKLILLRFEICIGKRGIYLVLSGDLTMLRNVDAFITKLMWMSTHWGSTLTTPGSHTWCNVGIFIQYSKQLHNSMLPAKMSSRAVAQLIRKCLIVIDIHWYSFRSAYHVTR